MFQTIKEKFDLIQTYAVDEWDQAMYISKQIMPTDNRGMFNNLSALALGIIVFAVIIGVGVVVLQEFGNAVGGSANTTVDYLNTELGSTGLAGWTPAIVAISVGVLFIGALAFLGVRGRGRSY